MKAYHAGYQNEPFELAGNVKWLSKENFAVFDNSEDADADYHYSVKVGECSEAGKEPKDIYCNVSGYFNSKNEPQIYSDDDGKAFFDAVMLDMPNEILEQVFDTVAPHLEQTRAEFEKRDAEREA